MSEHMRDCYFHLMAFGFKLRDYLQSREKIIADIGIKPGDSVLDYGCGPGSYILPLYRLVGDAGNIYAVDIHPLAIQYVQDLSRKKRLLNVTAIRSGNGTQLEDNCIDVALLYDILHDLADAETILKELHRVLKPDGILSVNDHHLEEEQIVRRVTQCGLFRLTGKTRQAVSFAKM